MRNSLFRRLHRELNSPVLPARLQTRSFAAIPFFIQRQPKRSIRNFATIVGTNDFVNSDGRFHGSRIRRLQSQIHNCYQNRVLIVGGGPTGLYLAHLLRSYNIPFRLLETQTPEQRFRHPQAHFLNTRTMEILKHGLSYNNKNSSNSIPSNEIYEELRKAMPPVEEWMSFRFGPNMTCSSARGDILAEVIHPVDRPLVAAADANGRLVSETADGDKKVTFPKKDVRGDLPLSPEPVGHLAQHKFCRILYDALVESPESATTTLNGDGDILYGRRLTGLDWNKENGLWTINTDQHEVFDDIDIILAADGAASTVRKNLFNNDAAATLGGDSSMLGTPNLQRLINVHFEVHSESTGRKDEHSNEQPRIPPAMLYTVFHSDVLAMVVRHGPGEYVLQIPYFDPYQTPEEDFSIDKVRKIVRSTLGSNDDFTIHSVRPWTMGSLVARNYYKEEGVFLVGDAAHVFPPAGGFGMNTGLQDAYSLAWRIAWKRQQEQLDEEEQTKANERNSSLSTLSTVGRLYERDRQPVARRNAALSVRNYRRVLNVMRACYLDDRHPALLIKALDATASFVPLGMRRKTFRTMLQTALAPLSQLQSSPNGIYARTIKENLRVLLGSGQGLPLLFPRHEVDFSYEKSNRFDDVENETEDWSQDSVASSPRLAPGMLFPHIVASVPLETLQKFPRLQPIEEGDEGIHDFGGDRDITPADTVRDSLWKVSTRDLAAQLSSKQTPLAFCLLEIVFATEDEDQSDKTLSGVKEDLEGRFRIPFLTSRLIVSRSCDGEIQLDGSNRKEEVDATICNMFVSRPEWDALNLVSASAHGRSLVVIRPDGHVASVSSDGDHTKNLASDIETDLMGE